MRRMEPSSCASRCIRRSINRTIYSPNYDPANPDLFVQRREGDPPHPAPFVNNLYDFAGHTYNFYASGFGFAVLRRAR